MKTSKQTIKKIIDYSQFFTATLLVTSVITILSTLYQEKEWQESFPYIERFLTVITVSFIGIVLLRELKWFTVKVNQSKDLTRSIFIYGISTWVSLACCVLFFDPFHFRTHLDLGGLALWIIITWILISGLIHPRYSIATVLIVCGASVLFFSPFAAYFAILKQAGQFTLLAIVIRLIVLTKWSKIILPLLERKELLQEKKENEL